MTETNETSPTYTLAYQEALARIAELERVLGMVEWCGNVHMPSFDSYCPWCDEVCEIDNQHHKPDCPRQAALGLMEGNHDSIG